MSNENLANAFPASVREDALMVAAKFPENPAHSSDHVFSVRLAGERVAIPERIYHDAAVVEAQQFVGIQNEIVSCLLTRHHDGFVRQRHLERIICSDRFWMPPFIIRLLGEYIVEILDVIEKNLSNLNISVYEQFVRWNPEFIALTEERIVSYWDQNFRPPGWGQRVYSKDEYVGFRLIRFFKSLAGNGHPN